MNHYLSSMKWIGMTLALCLLVVGCAAAGDMRTETESVELGSADDAKVHVKMDAGKLDIAGGAETLMQATFEYNVDKWQPSVEYSLNGSQGVLFVEQPDAIISMVGRGQTNHWDLRFNDAVPIDLGVETGASEAMLDLRGLDLTGLQVSVGVGSTTVDLSNALDHDLSASIDGGVGNLTVKLPDGMGVRVSASSGLGGLTRAGLQKDGNGYVNDAYGVSPHTLLLDISSGIGAIELLAQ